MPGKSLASPLLVIAQMEFAPPSGADRPSFEGKTLLLPGVGIGNIGPLAIDLLVCSATRARALGALWHDAVEPSSATRTAPARRRPARRRARRTLELFALGEACVALQLRAPTAPGRAAAFAAALAAWTRAGPFRRSRRRLRRVGRRARRRAAAHGRARRVVRRRVRASFLRLASR